MSRNTDLLNRLIAQVSKIIDEAITPQQSKVIGDDAAKQIRKRTRLGYGVDGSGKQTRLAPLSEGYKEFRESNSDDLSQATRPARSNLTGTGQMLDAMQGVGKRGKIEVEISGQRRGEVGGRRSKLSNATLARYVQENGRPFFGVTTAERTGIIRQVKQVLVRALRARLKSN